MNQVQKKVSWVELILCAFQASIILLFPFSFVRKHILEKYNGEAKASADNYYFLFDLSDRIISLERYLPWKYKCLQQSITAKIILNRRRYLSNVYFGTKSNEKKRDFHSWIKSCGLVLTGYSDVEEYFVIQKF